MTAGEVYNPSTTYYTATVSYTAVADTYLESNGTPKAWNNGPFGAVTTTASWNESQLTNLYYGSVDWQTSKVELKGKVTTETGFPTRWESNNSYTFVGYDGSNASYVFVTSTSEITDFTNKSYALAELGNQTGITVLNQTTIAAYRNTMCKYAVAASNLYVQHSGSTEYVGLSTSTSTNNPDYEYQAGDKFFTGSITAYTQIEDNSTFFYNTDGTNSKYIKNDETAITFNALLQRKISQGSYTTIKFVNEGTDDLKIDATTLRTILYLNPSSWSTNTTLTTLDLGATTVDNLSCADFFVTENEYRAQTLALNTLTLPKTTATDGTMTLTSEMMVWSKSGNNYNLGTVKTLIVPDGYTAIGANAFSGNAQLTSVTLPESVVSIGDNAFQNCKQITTIDLPSQLTTIGNYAFWSTGLTAVTFPSTLDKIGNGAFADCGIKDIKFNAGLRYVGAGAFAISQQLIQTTIEIPASVRFIGPGAFAGYYYQDVYFLGEKAPLMPMGSYTVGDHTTSDVTAFNSDVQMGNNGFIPNASEGTLRENIQTGYANRENYVSNKGYFTILHYPSGLSTEEANDYQDQTRVYQTLATGFTYPKEYTVGKESDETRKNWKSYGAMSLPSNGDVSYGFQDTYLGTQYVWPSQNQWGRAYITAANGYVWDGSQIYYSTLTETGDNNDLAILKEAGFIEDEISSLTDDQKKELQRIAHLGTRMFVLANVDSNKDDEPEKEPEYPLNIKSDGKWWTLCVPFNMTKAQVKEVFGTSESDPHVCRFNAVDRTETNGSKNVTLRFQKDVYVHKFVKTSTTTTSTSTGSDGKETTTTTTTYAYTDANSTVADEDIVIYAHEAYMIYPTKKLGEGEKYTVKNYVLETGSPNPTIVQANAATTEEGTDHTEYRFVGNYIGDKAGSKVETESDGTDTQATTAVMYVPQYSYMYAFMTGDSRYRFWFWTGATENGVVWNPNTCVVQATAKDGGQKEFSDIFGGESTSPSQGAKQTTLIGDEEGSTTGVDTITIIAGEDTMDAPVYNLNGQKVGNSLTGLSRGVYIQNGKKFVVK